MAGKPRLPLRLVRNDDPVSIAKAVIAGTADAEALLDDAVYKAALDQALGITRRTAAAHLADLDDYYARASAARFGKGSDQMSIFGVDPGAVNQMTEEQLVMYSTRVQEGIASTSSPIEKQQYMEFGGIIAKAMRALAASKEEMAKAIMTKKPDDAVEQAPPPAKNKGKGVSKNGTDAYKYDKPHGGKGPGKQPKSKKGPDAAPEPPEAAGGEDPAVSPPPPIDPKALATKLGVEVDNLKKLVETTKTREGFIAYFGNFKGVVQKFNLTAQYLSSLYDALTTPPAPPAGKTPPGAPLPKSAAPPAGPAPAAKPPAGMGKAILHFVGASHDQKTQELLKALQEHGVSNTVQMHRVLKAHFDLGDDQALHLTRTLLRQWEADAVVDLTPV